jgi:hypothetical protein
MEDYGGMARNSRLRLSMQERISLLISKIHRSYQETGEISEIVFI